MIEFLKNNYFLLILLGIAIIVVYIWLYLNRKKLNAKWWEVLIVTVSVMLIGVVTVKVFPFIEVVFNQAKPGNVSLFGAIIFLPIYFFVYAKIKKLPIGLVFDIFTIALIVTAFVAKFNCLHEGCCYGKEIGSTVYRYPTREIELIFLLVFSIVLIPLIYSNKLGGFGYCLFIIGYCVMRFIVECLTEPTSGGLHSIVFGWFNVSHIWSMILIVVSLILIIILKKRRS